MKKIIITCLLVASSLNSQCQNVFDPYINNSQLPNSAFEIIDINSWSIGYKWWDRSTPGDILTGYSGEYEILMDRTPWYSVLNLHLGNVHVSLDFEIVSFPFMPECAFFTQGCSGLLGTTTRNLIIPHDIYDPVEFRWGDLYNKFHVPYLNNSFDQTLVSKAFINDSPYFSNSTKKLLPHTVIKHTINIHCGAKVTSTPYPPIIYSFSWIYDNTRGRMRYYPPCSCNGCSSANTTCTMVDWDIAFSPEFIKYSIGYDYLYNVATDNRILSQGTLDYFPYNELLNIPYCSLPELIKPANQNIVFHNGVVNAFNFAYLPSFGLVSAPALQWRGVYPAGWENHITLPNMMQAIGGYQHQYNANENININEISTSDHIFYNPSDVTITATDLHFPSYYSFRTISGEYPSPLEVAADNTAINGGPFNDLRDVPVLTDLRCEDATFPHNASNPDDAKYASLYRLAAGSKLTLEPCVRVFDAAFILNPGSTLELANKTSIIGLHRVAIDRNGGRLIEKYELNSGILYLQKKTETALAPNTYYVNSKIFAGENVDVSSLPGPYIASTGTNLELIARDHIKLDHGFHAENGSEVKIQIDPFMQIPACPPPASGGSGNRFANLAANSIVDATAHIKLLPTLFTNSTGIYSENKNEDPIISVEVLDASGKKIKQINEINDYFVEVNLSNLNDGMYFFIIQTNNNRKVLKGVKQN